MDYQCGVTVVAHRKRLLHRLCNRCVAQIHRIGTVDRGAVNLYPVRINRRQHIISRCIRKGSLNQIQGIIAVAMQLQLEGGHHPIAAVQGQVLQMRDEHHQRITRNTRRCQMPVGTFRRHLETSLHVCQCGRQDNLGLQPHNAVHIVHPQRDSDDAIGFAGS